MLNLAFLCHSSLGGSARVAVELADCLAALGHKITLFSRTPLTIKPQQKQGIRLVSLKSCCPEPKSIGQLWLNWPQDQISDFSDLLLTEMARNSFDAIHFHYGIPFLAVLKLARARSRFTLPPIIGTLHGTDVTRFQDNAAAGQRFGRELNATCADLTTVSHAHAQLSRELLNLSEPPTVIPNFVDFNKFKPNTHKTDIDRPFTIAHVSNFRNIKNPIDVARIFVKLKQQSRRELTLKLIGSGPELNNTLNYLRDHNCENAVEAPGYCANVTAQLNQSDLLLLSSCYESFSMAALEAQACGLPVVATHVGGLPEVVKHEYSGYLYQSGAIDQAVDQLLTLIENRKSHRQFAHNALCQANQFDATKIVPRYLNLYRRAHNRLALRSNNAYSIAMESSQ